MTHGLNAWVITQDDVAEEPRVWDVECGRYARFSEGCHTRSCKRILEDNFVTREQASQLIAIAQLGISLRPPTAGPTIVVGAAATVPLLRPHTNVALAFAPRISTLASFGT